MKSFVHASLLSSAALVVLLDSVSGQAQGPLSKVSDVTLGTRAGYSVAMIGDLTNDGRAEYIVGAPFAGPSLSGNFVVFTFPQGATASTALYSGTGNIGSRFGYSCAGLGDLDGDGRAEYCVGAIGGNGYVDVYSGANGGLIRRLTGATQPGQNGAEFGKAVANLGDVNNDGFDDLGVGAPGDMATNGQVWVYSGLAIINPPGGTNIAPLYTIVSSLYPAQYPEAFGSSLDGIGDLDGDGRAEILIGAPDYDPNGTDPQTGAAYVYSGTTLLFSSFGGLSGERHGHSVRRAGDVNQGGKEDFMIGAPNAGSFAGAGDGRVRLISGETFQVLYNFTGNAIYVAMGDACASQLGWSMMPVGDLDGDSYPDLALGAPTDRFVEPDRTPQLPQGGGWFLPPSAWTAPHIGSSVVGLVRVMSGRTKQLLKTYSGDFNGADFGLAIAGLGDVDGDGTNDIVVGAPATTAGAPMPGYHTVHSGAYELGQVYGYSNTNSTGWNGLLRATGSTSMTENGLRLKVAGVPGNMTGQFYFGPNMLANPVAVSMGLNWIGNPIYRFGTLTTPPNGPSGFASFEYLVDLSAHPFPGVAAIGTEFAFQFYFRDTAAGAGASNLTDALNLGLLP